MSDSYSAVLLAAGPVVWFGEKLVLKEKVGGKSILGHSLDFFDQDENCSEIIMVASRDVHDWVKGDPLTFASGKLSTIPAEDGYCASVRAGARKASAELVVVHDANRPNFGVKLVDNLIKTVKPEIGAVPAVAADGSPVHVTEITGDSASNGDADGARGNIFADSVDHRIGHVMDHADPERLYILQSPRVYYRESLLKALDSAEGGLDGDPDESALYLAYGNELAVVEGLLGNVAVVAPDHVSFLLKLMGGGTKKKKDKYGGLGW